MNPGAKAEVRLSSDVQVRNGLHLARLNRPVTFECQVTDTFRLDWIIVPFVNSSNPIRFLSSNDVGRDNSRSFFYGKLTEQIPGANMTSTLSFVVQDSLNGITIQCTDGPNNAIATLLLSGELFTIMY